MQTASETFIRNFPKHYGLGMKIYANVINILGKAKVVPVLNQLSKSDKKKFKKSLRPGDIVLIGGLRDLSSLFVQGAVTHGLIYVGKNTFFHATAHGVERTKMKKVFKMSDTLITLRHPGMNPKKLKKMKLFLRSQLGTPYNFNFEEEEGSVICSELIKKAFENSGLKMKLRPMQSYTFYKIVHPMDFALSESVNLIFNSKNLEVMPDRIVYLPQAVQVD
jgi:cell wall-associated NlpC family hydrolase